MKVFLVVLALVLAINSQDINGLDILGTNQIDYTDIDKAEMIGHLSEESINGINPQDKTVPGDVEPGQILFSQHNQQISQGRRKLDALQDFKDRCAITSGGKGYVDCNGGYAVVNGVTTDKTCAEACGGDCCIEYDACEDFTGNVCKDKSCDNHGACESADIPYVVGPSCVGFGSCYLAQIGSVDSSCNDTDSCYYAVLSGVDLINSCNKFLSCAQTNENGEDFELIDCCNDEDLQCYQEQGANAFYASGCPVPTISPTISPMPSISISHMPSREPSEAPSEKPSKAPSQSDLAIFEARCAITSDGKGYVDCRYGNVVGSNGQTCADACGGDCCTGRYACNSGFTGKVCRDRSCGYDYACYEATIDYVSGPSCTDKYSCYYAYIGSVDSSCTGLSSCAYAQIGSATNKSCTGSNSCNGGALIRSVDSSCKGTNSCLGAKLIGTDNKFVDLIDSCNAIRACQETKPMGAFTELIDCCNEPDQCYRKSGHSIVDAGGATCNAPTSKKPSKRPPIKPSKEVENPSGPRPSSPSPTKKVTPSSNTPPPVPDACAIITQKRSCKKSSCKWKKSSQTCHKKSAKSGKGGKRGKSANKLFE